MIPSKREQLKIKRRFTRAQWCRRYQDFNAFFPKGEIRSAQRRFFFNAIPMYYTNMTFLTKKQ